MDDQKPPPRPNESTVLTPEQAAAVLNIGRNACYAALARGDIPSVRIGRLYRIPREALLRKLESVG